MLNLFGLSEDEDDGARHDQPMFKHTFHVDITPDSILYHMLRKIMTALEQLQADIAADKAVKDQAITLLVTMAEQINTLLNGVGGATDAQLAALSTTLQGQNKVLADAIAAQTAPPVVVPPPATP